MFIWNHPMGMDVFKSIPPLTPLIVAGAVWQYSYHVLAGLRDHQGPILTVANWSGQWPSLVGLLNLNGSLTKMGVNYSTSWGGTSNNKGRTIVMKKAFYKTLVKRLNQELALRMEDILINLGEVKKENWSFGNSVAQYAQA